ncbi:MAG TPA: hypothetical protein VIN56_08645, partial [Candidatus Dormibacteraeota bacterium]
MADADVTLAGIEGRQGATAPGATTPRQRRTPGQRREPVVDDPRRAHARRSNDLLSPELEVGMQEI